MISAVSVVEERSQTLARVRDIDFQIIESLLSAAKLRGLDSIDIDAVQGAFDRLRGSNSGKPRIGLLLEKDGVIVASNIEPLSVNDLKEQYGLNANAIVKTELGGGWNLFGILIDRKYDFTSWHSFLTVPYKQFMDGRDANWGVISHKAEVPFMSMLIAGLVLLVLWAIWWRHASMKVHRLEEYVEQASIRLESTEQALVEAESEAAILLYKMQTSKTGLEETEKKMRSITEKLRGLENSSDLQKSEIDKLQRDRDELKRYSEKNKLELDELEQCWEASENEREQIQKKLDAELREHEELAEKLKNTEGTGNKACYKILKNLWNIDWHPEALKEACIFFTRSGQPSERRQLSELLYAITHIKDAPPDKSKWSPFKTHTDAWVWHNPGKQQAKLYWAKLEGKMTVIAAASGKDDHQKFDGGDTLKQRVELIRTTRHKAT